MGGAERGGVVGGYLTPSLSLAASSGKVKQAESNVWKGWRPYEYFFFQRNFDNFYIYIYVYIFIYIYI